MEAFRSSLRGGGDTLAHFTSRVNKLQHTLEKASFENKVIGAFLARPEIARFAAAINTYFDNKSGKHPAEEESTVECQTRRPRTEHDGEQPVSALLQRSEEHLARAAFNIRELMRLQSQNDAILTVVNKAKCSGFCPWSASKATAAEHLQPGPDTIVESETVSPPRICSDAMSTTGLSDDKAGAAPEAARMPNVAGAVSKVADKENTTPSTKNRTGTGSALTKVVGVLDARQRMLAKDNGSATTTPTPTSRLQRHRFKLKLKTRKSGPHSAHSHPDLSDMELLSCSPRETKDVAAPCRKKSRLLFRLKSSTGFSCESQQSVSAAYVSETELETEDEEEENEGGEEKAEEQAEEENGDGGEEESNDGGEEEMDDVGEAAPPAVASVDPMAFVPAHANVFEGETNPPPIHGTRTKSAAIRHAATTAVHVGFSAPASVIARCRGQSGSMLHEGVKAICPRTLDMLAAILEKNPFFEQWRHSARIVAPQPLNAGLFRVIASYFLHISAFRLIRALINILISPLDFEYAIAGVNAQDALDRGFEQDGVPPCQRIYCNDCMSKDSKTFFIRGWTLSMSNSSADQLEQTWTTHKVTAAELKKLFTQVKFSCDTRFRCSDCHRENEEAQDSLWSEMKTCIESLRGNLGDEELKQFIPKNLEIVAKEDRDILPRRMEQHLQNLQFVPKNRKRKHAMGQNSQLNH